MGYRLGPTPTAVLTCNLCNYCPARVAPKLWQQQALQAYWQQKPRHLRKYCTRAAQAAEQTLEDVKPAFDRCTTEEEFLQTLKAALNHPRAPDFLFPAFHDFYNNYKNAVIGSGVEGADEREVTKVMSAIADRVVHEFVEPFSFPSQHQRILEPYNYYQFGQNYVRNLIDFKRSYVGNLHNFDKIEQLLAKGDNVVVLANHQTEADPAVWALLLQHTHPRIATDVHYVAGDRVVSDPLCKPFSMGRNLFCVHSKKHMEDDPALKAAKTKTNRQTLITLSRELNKGGLLLWIAPSGGRDRPNEEGVWMPARFDPSAVELMRHLTSRAKPDGHLFPLAMHSGEMMPPPRSTEKALGERRLTNFTSVGVAAGDELDVSAVTNAVTDDASSSKGQIALADAAFEIVTDLYLKLEAAIRDPSKRAGFHQPWEAQ